MKDIGKLKIILAVILAICIGIVVLDFVGSNFNKANDIQEQSQKSSDKASKSWKEYTSGFSSKFGD